MIRRPNQNVGPKLTDDIVDHIARRTSTFIRNELWDYDLTQWSTSKGTHLRPEYVELITDLVQYVIADLTAYFLGAGSEQDAVLEDDELRLKLARALTYDDSYELKG